MGSLGVNYIILLFLGHKFPTTNAGKPIKGSKDADYRHVVIEKKKKLGLGVGARVDEVGQKCLSLHYYDVTHKKYHPRFSYVLKI